VLWVCRHSVDKVHTHTCLCPFSLPFCIRSIGSLLQSCVFCWYPGNLLLRRPCMPAYILNKRLVTACNECLLACLMRGQVESRRGRRTLQNAPSVLSPHQSPPPICSSRLATPSPIFQTFMKGFYDDRGSGCLKPAGLHAKWPYCLPRCHWRAALLLSRQPPCFSLSGTRRSVPTLVSQPR